jgi:hypothetical protein
MKGRMLLTAIVTALVAMPAGIGYAASDKAGCVGTYSSYYAQQGLRDAVAHRYSQGNQVYSFVAQYHGDGPACDAQLASG